jgi:hypothetical protein
MEQIDESHVAFTVPQPAHYAFDTLADEESMNLDFSPLPEFEPLSEASITANGPVSVGTDQSALNHATRPTQRASTLRRIGTNGKHAANPQRHAVQPPTRARTVTQQFGQAAVRLRSFDERLSKIEQQ